MLIYKYLQKYRVLFLFLLTVFTIIVTIDSNALFGPLAQYGFYENTYFILSIYNLILIIIF